MEEKIHEFNPQVVDDDQMVLSDIGDLEEEEYSSDAIAELFKLPTRVSKALDTQKDLEAIKAMVDDGEYQSAIEMVKNDSKLSPQQKTDLIMQILDHRNEALQKGGEINNKQRESKGKTIVLVVSSVVSGIVAVCEYFNWRKRK